MATFSVSTQFKGIDKMSKVFGKISRNGKKAFGKIGGFTEKLNRKMGKFGKLGGKIGAFAGITGGLLLVKSALTSTIKKGLEFEQTMVNASTKFVDKIQKGSPEFDALKKKAKEVGEATEFSATQAAQGLDFLALAGFNSKQAMAALGGTVDLATAANMDLGTATDIATDSLGAFNLMSKDSAQLTKNLTRVNDVLAKTSTTANTSIQDMFEAIKDGAPVATAAGASIEEFSALIGLLANTGIKGTKAGTTLKNMFLNLQAPTKAQAKLLKKLRIEIQDDKGEMLKMSNIIGQLNKSTSKMTQVQRNAAIATIFGKRAVAGATNLLKLGQKEIEKYTKSLEGATGESKRMAAAMRDTTQNRIKKMNSAIEALQLTLFDALKPILEKVIFTITDLAGVVSKFAKENPGVVKAITIMAAVLGTLAIAIVAVTAVTWLFTAALAANPIGLVIIAIGALVAATLWLVSNWEFAVNWFQENFGLILAGIIVLAPAFAPLVLLAKVLLDNWEPVSSFFIKFFEVIKNVGSLMASVFQGIVSLSVGAGAAIADALLTPLNAVLNALVKIPILGEKLKGFQESIAETRTELQAREKQEIGVISTQIQTARSITENISKSTAELFIKDDTGRADLRTTKENEDFFTMQSTVEPSFSRVGE